MTSCPTIRDGRGVAVIGGGPAGLMAAERMAAAGLAVTVFDRMPSPGRKLLVAGRGGLNLTHTEPLDRLLGRYGAARPALEAAVRAFPPDALRAWCAELGQETWVGSSGRVFPAAFKATPLLRAWLGRLAGQGVQLRPGRRWVGWDSAGALRFVHSGNEVLAHPAATVLALGGASWSRLGSDAAWVSLLRERGVRVNPLRPSNCGFLVPWSDAFRTRFEGAPLKRIALAFEGRTVRGEAVVTADGIEGGAVYALSAPLRDAVSARGSAVATLDLRPDLDPAALAARLAAPRRAQSLSNWLRKTAGLPPVAIGLLREGGAVPDDPGALAARIKAVPLRLVGTRPLDQAISSAGGIALDELDEHLMLRRLPGVFAAGEMLDWEAPTGGYLLQAAFSTGWAAGEGAARSCPWPLIPAALAVGSHMIPLLPRV